MEEGEMGGMIPLGDASRRPTRAPVVTILSIVVNSFVFVVELMGGEAPARTTLFENKRSQSACIKPAGFLSNPPEQLANVNAVVVEGHIAGTPLLVHPLTEGRQQSRIMRCDRSLGDDPAISQVG
jgi:hypothetical protein